MLIWHFFPYDDSEPAANIQALRIREDLVDLLTAVKQKFRLPGAVMEEEMKEFVRRIFRHNFCSDETHGPLDDRDTTPGMLTTSNNIGVLRRDLPLSRRKITQHNRSASSDASGTSCAAQHRAQLAQSLGGNDGLQEDRYRRAGAPLYLRAVSPVNSVRLRFEVVGCKECFDSAGY